MLLYPLFLPNLLVTLLGIASVAGTSPSKQKHARQAELHNWKMQIHTIKKPKHRQLRDNMKHWQLQSELKHRELRDKIKHRQLRDKIKHRQLRDKIKHRQLRDVPERHVPKRNVMKTVKHGSSVYFRARRSEAFLILWFFERLWLFW
ncbi:hypothetical protein GPALN_012369 [Globodera pallida]|nr:hypothetical protein GPALN_012369 [Globodera pallida]